MRASHFVLTGLVLSLGLGCNVSLTYQDSVPVTSEPTPDENLEIAKAVAIQVWEAGLKDQIAQEFPDLSASDLQGIDVRWNWLTKEPQAGADREPRTEVSIQCVYQRRGGPNLGKPIVEFCKRVVEDALESYGVGSAEWTSAIR